MAYVAAFFEKSCLYRNCMGLVVFRFLFCDSFESSTETIFEKMVTMKKPAALLCS